MAEGSATWWSNLLTSAKEKSSNVLEFMKRDLDEFTQVVSHETKSYVSTAAEALKGTLNARSDDTQDDESASTVNKVKRSVSSFLGSVSNALASEIENEESELCVIQNSEPVIMDRVQVQLYSLQANPKTYLEDPDGNLKDYEEWLSKFDLEVKQDELADLMANNAQVQKLYTKVVPSSVSHVVFWHRYFYKLNKMLKAEERKKEIVQRAVEPGDDIAWDEDDDFAGTQELSEDTATQVLAAYEKECEVKNSSRQRLCLPKLPASSESPNVSACSVKSSSESFVMVDEASPVSSNELLTSTSTENNLTTKEKGDLIVVGKCTSIGTSPASKSSNDEEWEREFELEVNEDDVRNMKPEQVKPEVEEEWEKWE
uniref:BSD domain-containing protein n=1 Tax=Strigamia maritima TaxID=126957 RepID=T1IYQ7_STRMM